MPNQNLQIEQKKLREKFLKKGVHMIAPDTVFFSKETSIGKNVVIEPYVVFSKKVKIGNNVTIKSFSHLEGVIIEDKVDIGPYARIRPDVKIQTGARIGNFVEIKKSNIGKNSKINHLSYVGDTVVGKNVNVGAGTITCNYDGVRKNKTNIKDDAFIGSNSSLVAPITINKKSIVGAGSVITKNVIQKSLALTRSNQITVKNYKRK
jgi:UDP-N-acetylglucosamine diphosphorylase/glucosamine-1-phosphate N-acetyltransferase